MRWAKNIWVMVKTAALDWNADNAPRLGAALSYYTVFALAPLVILVVVVAGVVFGEAAVRQELVDQFNTLIGQQGAEVIQTVIANAQDPGGGIVGTVVGLVLLLVGASGVFGELKADLNLIWEVEPKPGRGIWNMVRTRLLSFAMVMVIAFLLMVSLVVSAVLAGLREWLGERLSIPPGALQAINFVVSLGVITVLFALVYKILPDARIRWSEVWIGALITAALFTVGKFAIGLYLGRSSVSSVYGAAGSLVVVLLWVYYSSLILLFGAELTQVYASMFGKGIRPAPYATRVANAQKPAVRPVPRDEGVGRGDVGRERREEEGRREESQSDRVTK